MPTPLEILSMSFRVFDLDTQDRIACPRCNPTSVGVYVLILGGQVAYIGSSVNVYARIMAHRSNSRRANLPGPKRFDGALVLPLPAGVLKAYEGALIRTLRPRFNVASHGDQSSDAEILYGLGMRDTLTEDEVSWQEVA